VDVTESATWTVTIRVPDDSSLDTAGETHELRVSEDEYILAAARASGLWLPADCQQGWCITCASKLVEGEIDQSDARRYYEEDREAGFALICTARPRSDVVIEVDAYDELLRQRADNDQPPGNSKLG
jgi:ferredoxin